MTGPVSICLSGSIQKSSGGRTRPADNKELSRGGLDAGKGGVPCAHIHQGSEMTGGNQASPVKYVVWHMCFFRLSPQSVGGQGGSGWWWLGKQTVFGLNKQATRTADQNAPSIFRLSILRADR
jgi:hypothetical protein